MIETYAFFAGFTVQILAMSVLGPIWFTRFVRVQALSSPVERFSQHYPGIDYNEILGRYLARYRVLNNGIALVGMLLLGWLVNYMQRPDWSDGPMEAIVNVYFMVQTLPLCLVAWIALKYNKMLAKLIEGKRKAFLQPRGLFDFVSPFTVFLAALSYCLFVAYVIYIARNPFPGFAGSLVNIIAMTLIYALSAFAAYRRLYGRKRNPLETHAARVHTISWGVKASVYNCIAAVVALSLNFTLVLLDLQRWEPFGQSIYLAFTALLSFRAFTTPPGQPKVNELDESPV